MPRTATWLCTRDRELDHRQALSLSAGMTPILDYRRSSNWDAIEERGG